MIVTSQTFKPENPRGFIVIEGVNGAGKSTVLVALEEYLKKRQRSVCRTFEPGATPLGKELRKLLLNSPGIPRSSTAELLLFGADRSEHLQKVILPALAEKKIVLSDRYIYSTTAFQGFGRGLDDQLINHINSIATQNILPDLVILLDIDVRLGLERTLKRNSEMKIDNYDSFEQEAIDFHQRIREGFHQQAQKCSEAFYIINAQQSQEDVQAEAISIVERLLECID